MTDQLSRGTGVCSCDGGAGHVERRIVLTGGPGAGKTAVLEVLRRHLCVHGVVLPESAGIVFGGGFPRRSSRPARRAAQVAIACVQLQLEALVAGEDHHSAIIACDRGALDGLAYWDGAPEEYFAAISRTRTELLARYHTVIHLRVPPAGEYDHSNPLRLETLADARALDEKIAQAWEGHPRRFFVESSARFLDKVERTLALVREAMPACCRSSLDGAP